MDEQLAEILAHYVKLAQLPEWKQYVWHQVNQMAQEHYVFRELPDLLVKAVKHEQVRKQENPNARNHV